MVFAESVNIILWGENQSDFISFSEKPTTPSNFQSHVHLSQNKFTAFIQKLQHDTDITVDGATSLLQFVNFDKNISCYNVIWRDAWCAVSNQFMHKYMW